MLAAATADYITAYERADEPENTVLDEKIWITEIIFWLGGVDYALELNQNPEMSQFQVFAPEDGKNPIFCGYFTGCKVVGIYSNYNDDDLSDVFEKAINNALTDYMEDISWGIAGQA